MTPAGWYPDPANPQLIRYWDGTQWTPETKSRPLPQHQPDYVLNPPQSTPQESPSKKTNRTIWKVCGVVLAVFIVGNVVSAAMDDSPRSSASQSRVPDEVRTTFSTEAAALPKPPDAADPRETINYPDGLAVTVTALTGGQSTNSFDGDGPFTIISIELRNTGTDTFDAADWWTPYLNYGPGGSSAEDAWLSGTVNGIKSDGVKGSGLIPPGGVVTVNSAYEVSVAQLSPATITPQWPGRRLWTGDFAAAFGG
ncbi:DUF2510 domain-containing protein [Rhodococcus sp. Leaf278]|uniref:DUF2510 domain-containing protein n=1 Tax=Rhodococcus sp. Leaf278 TaxID=1736319 RepID=UPI0009E8EA5F|nr:DUF2510 domain-containing protein [Rhodococcus sp. Leaf278]